MTRWRILAIAAVTSVGLAALVVVGRHERTHEYARQLARIEAVRRLVGDSIDSPKLNAFRADPGFLCLFYASGKRFFALELCYDPQGRLIESVDRRGVVPVYGSIAYRPELAPVTVPPGELRQVLIRHKVRPADLAIGGL